MLRRNFLSAMFSPLAVAASRAIPAPEMITMGDRAAKDRPFVLPNCDCRYAGLSAKFDSENNCGTITLTGIEPMTKDEMAMFMGMACGLLISSEEE